MKQPSKEDRRRARAFKVYARLSLLALAAMVTARMTLFSTDIIQLRAGTVGGEICTRVYAALLIYTGWKLKGWVYEHRKGNRKCTTKNVPGSRAASTRTNRATAQTKGSVRRGA